VYVAHACVVCYLLATAIIFNLAQCVFSYVAPQASSRVFRYVKLLANLCILGKQSYCVYHFAYNLGSNKCLL
jgi:hypothetical protein